LQVLRLLEILALEKYTLTFKEERIDGNILSTCNETILKDDLKVNSGLHRMKLLRLIEGTYSVQVE
jgi:hypothetical protein